MSSFTKRAKDAFVLLYLFRFGCLQTGVVYSSMSTSEARCDVALDAHVALCDSHRR